jgi:hypothetical protein
MYSWLQRQAKHCSEEQKSVKAIAYKRIFDKDFWPDAASARQQGQILGSVAVVQLSSDQGIWLCGKNRPSCMAESGTQKRAGAMRCNPLCYPGVLARALSYAGPEQWLFIGPVSKLWQSTYLSMAFADTDHVLCSHPSGWAKRTSRKQVFASASRVKAARAQGFQWTFIYNDLWSPAEAATNCERMAGEFGCRDALAAAHELGMPFTEATAEGAAQAKCLPKLQWLLTEAGCPYTGTNLMLRASCAGDLESMQLLKTLGAAYNSEVLSAGLKHWHVVQFLLGEGCQFDPYGEACPDAAGCGSLDVLKFCHAQGYPWDSTAVGVSAAMSGNMEMLLWLADELHTTWAPSTLQEMLLNAGLEDALDVCQWLRAQGAEWPAVLGDENRGYGWTGEVLQWAREQGCTSEEYYNSDSDASQHSDHPDE